MKNSSQCTSPKELPLSVLLRVPVSLVALPAHPTHSKAKSNLAFSLVELSIVLVILGLLAGGVLSGQSLIRAAELRSVSADYARYITAVQSFRDKYFAIPGDMSNATAFWGDNNSACPDAAVTNGTPGTCNGDGNGQVGLNGVGPTANATSETYQFWSQLAYARLVEGSYSGIAGASGTEAVIGTNVPRARLKNGCYNVGNYNGGNAVNYVLDYGNIVTVGLTNTYDCSNPIFKPEEAWNIDTKLDDGMPAQGKIIAVFPTTCANSTGETDYAGRYRLDSSSVACSLRYRSAF